MYTLRTCFANMCMKQQNVHMFSGYVRVVHMSNHWRGFRLLRYSPAVPSHPAPGALTTLQPSAVAKATLCAQSKYVVC